MILGQLRMRGGQTKNAPLLIFLISHDKCFPVLVSEPLLHTMLAALILILPLVNLGSAQVQTKHN